MRPTRKSKNLITSLLLAALLLLSLPLAAFAETSTAAPATRLVAFGDSITAGYEPDMEANASMYGFVDRLYEQALYRGRASVANYGVVGLNSTGLNKLLAAVSAGTAVKGSDLQSDLDVSINNTAFPVAQMKKDLQAATHVTITIGINDIGTDIITRYREMNDDQLKAFAEERLKSYSDNLTAALTTIYAVNPKVKVIIADQYSPIPAVLAAVYNKLKPIKDSMTAALEGIVKSFADKQFAVQMSPVAAAFVGKEGLYTHINMLDVNPTQEGFTAIAQEMAKTIWGENKSVTRVPGLITVVIGGKMLDTPFLPLLVDGSTYVPPRDYMESLGAEVSWTDATKTATIKYNGNQVDLTINSDVIKINGVEKKIQDIPRMYVSAGEDKTYVPLRLMVEGLGLDVQYTPGSHTAYINK